jgi:hypothetical protein
VFYDVRAAEAARHALNKSDNSEKRSKMERSYLGGTNWYTIRPYFAHLFNFLVFFYWKTGRETPVVQKTLLNNKKIKKTNYKADYRPREGKEKKQRYLYKLMRLQN